MIIYEGTGLDGHYYALVKENDSEHETKWV
jgi:hypothetical protein